MAKRNLRAFYFNQIPEGVKEQRGVFVSTPSHADYIQNLHVDKLGEFTSANYGYSTLKNSQATDGVQTIFYHVDTDEKEYMGIWTGTFLSYYNITDDLLFERVNSSLYGSVYYGGSEYGGSVTLSGHLNSTQFQDKTILCFSETNPHVFEPGTPLAAAANFPITIGSNTYARPRYVETYANRVVYANFQDNPNTIVISELLDYTGFSTGSNDTDAIEITISPGDGQRITAIKSLYSPSTNQEVLVIFRTNSIFFVVGSTPSTVQVVEINRGWGAVNPYAVETLGSDLFFADTKGLFSVQASTDAGVLKPIVAGSMAIQDTYETLNQQEIDNMWVKYVPSKEELLVGLPVGSSQQVNRVLCGRYYEGSLVWSVLTDINYVKPIILRNGRVLSCTTDGTVVRLYNGSTHNGVQPSWVYRFPFLGFDSLLQNKTLRDLVAYFRARVPSTVTTDVSFRHSYGNKTSTITKSWKSFLAIYNIDTFGEALYTRGSDLLSKLKVPVRGNGQQIQIQLQGTLPTTGLTFLGCAGVVEYGKMSREFI